MVFRQCSGHFLFQHSRTFSNSKRRHLSSYGLPTAAPLPSTSPRSIVFGSCSSQDGDLSYWTTIRQQNPDLIVLMEDNVYGGTTISSLRTAYQTLAKEPSFQRVFASVPILATLDDNDYLLGQDPEAAKDEFCDFWQVPEQDQRREKGRGVYTSHIWGQELQIIMLDVRYHQNVPFRPNATPISKLGPFSPDEDPAKTLLGDSQWHWLEQQLQLPVRRRILVSPIQVLPKGHRWDCWNLLPLERERLVKLVEDHSDPNTTTIILSGDRHFAAFYCEGRIVEITSSSLTHSCPAGLIEEEDSSRLGKIICDNNFGRIEIHDDKGVITVHIQNAQTGRLCSHPSNPLAITK